jgi:hypothetical protein
VVVEFLSAAPSYVTTTSKKPRHAKKRNFAGPRLPNAHESHAREPKPPDLDPPSDSKQNEIWDPKNGNLTQFRTRR